MFRKMMFSMCFMSILVLAGGAGSVYAKRSPMSVEKVFTAASATSYLRDMHEFQSVLYLAVSDEDNGGQIWRSVDGNSWKPTTGLGFGISPSYRSSWGMTVFRGKLYVAANCYPTQSPDCPGMILRSANGKDWQQIALATGSALLDKLGVNKGMIYATSVSNPVGPGGQIWRSPSGDPGSWEVVKDLDSGVWSTSAPTEFEGQVYITGSTGGADMLIWHSADGLHWDTTNLNITSQPVDPNNDYLADGRLIEFHGRLYFCVSNSIDGGTIYSTKDGVNWDKVVDQTALRIGYRDMIQFDGDLYVTVFSFVDGDNFGIQLWRSHTGKLGSWELVNLDPANWGALTGTDRGMMAIIKGKLYISNYDGNVYRVVAH